ncbi:hypothetical protein [Reichenbachiella ulvae]|uniref:Uncharacterized protein n=1 Tax=Reichenbachiella ulvae TaxID=2980104 RepID=A0ABT3CW32_9BACT|nr:hypothetical protein [Reichenbachiella ulvae]MCV9387448.1 hypothetical protein [Reichenbachiella ulvae]
MKKLILLFFLFGIFSIQAQEATYDVVSGTGNGLRFWSSNSYKIHMGDGAEYHYGPVSSYSIIFIPHITVQTNRLKKIEDLMLHQIEMMKIIKTQGDKIKELEKPNQY